MGEQEGRGVGHKDGVINARKRGCRSSLLGLSFPFVFVSPAWFLVAGKGWMREAERRDGTEYAPKRAKI